MAAVAHPELPAIEKLGFRSTSDLSTHCFL
jgi:hypothetical protein